MAGEDVFGSWERMKWGWCYDLVKWEKQICCTNCGFLCKNRICFLLFTVWRGFKGDKYLSIVKLTKGVITTSFSFSFPPPAYKKKPRLKTKNNQPKNILSIHSSLNLLNNILNIKSLQSRKRAFQTFQGDHLLPIHGYHEVTAGGFDSVYGEGGEGLLDF